MIDLLENWIRNLITIVILANIIELLLPNSSMRRYVKVVMGFFILLTVLHPLFNLLKVDLSTFSVFDNSVNQKKIQATQSQGNALKKKNQRLAVSAFERHLAEQIKALILTQREVSDASVQVTADVEGKIKDVVICLTVREEDETSSSKRNSSIREIKILVDLKAGKKTEEVEVLATKKIQEIQNRTAKLVISFYNLKPEAISFQ